MKPLPKKYVMTAKKIILVDGTILYQIKAVRNFGSVKRGELGGFIENDRNLSHEGTCWVKGNAKVFGNAKVYENAVISSGSSVFGDSQIYGNAHVCERSLICGHATICDSAQIHGAAVVCMNARISDSAEVSGRALIYWDAEICGNSRVCGGIIGDSARISNSRDYAVVGPVGLYSEQLTFYRTKDGNIHVIFNVSDHCSTPLETFKRDISKKDILSWGDSNKYRDEYMNAIKYVEAVMATTQPMERNVGEIMKDKKYIMTDETKTLEDGTVLHRIKAIKDFGDVKEGDLGGWIEKEENLSHEGNCWVYNDAKVYESATVRDNAVVCDCCSVFDHAKIYGNAGIYRISKIWGRAVICDSAQIHGYVIVSMDARIHDSAVVTGCTWVYMNAEIYGNSKVHGGFIGHAAEINKSQDCLVIGYGDAQLTCYRTNDGGVRVTSASMITSRPLETFKRNVSEKDTRLVKGVDKYYDEYMKAIKYFEDNMAIQPMKEMEDK